MGVPEALGLTTEEWVEERLGGYVRLNIPERREAVTELSEEGLSNVAVAEVLGVGEATVRRDRASSNDEPEPEIFTGSEAEEPIASSNDEPTPIKAAPEPTPDPEDTDLGKEILEMPPAKQRAAVKRFTAACLATATLGPQIDHIAAAILAADVDAQKDIEISLGVWEQLRAKLADQSKLRRIK
jgi:hypothetical protein